MVGGGGPEGVGGAEHHVPAVGDQHPGQLAGGGGLAGAVDPDDQQHRRPAVVRQRAHRAVHVRVRPPRSAPAQQGPRARGVVTPCAATSARSCSVISAAAPAPRSAISRVSSTSVQESSSRVRRRAGRAATCRTRSATGTAGRGAGSAGRRWARSGRPRGLDRGFGIRFAGQPACFAWHRRPVRRPASVTTTSATSTWTAISSTMISSRHVRALGAIRRPSVSWRRRRAGRRRRCSGSANPAEPRRRHRPRVGRRPRCARRSVRVGQRRRERLGDRRAVGRSPGRGAVPVPRRPGGERDRPAGLVAALRRRSLGDRFRRRGASFSEMRRRRASTVPVPSAMASTTTTAMTIQIQVGTGQS